MDDVLSKRYGFGPAFAAEWLRVWGSDLSELLGAQDGSVDQLWGDFTLSANLRGREMAVDVASVLSWGTPSLAGRRALDLGCGVGGTAVALAELGAATMGIDLDPDRVNLAAANALDRKVEVGLSTTDVLDPAARAGIGQFDVIVAEDVLEHVADAADGVAALAELLAQGGLARVTIPNGDAVPLVIADAHYLLPGLTLLDDRKQAAAYFDASFEWGEYDVGDYHSYDDYVGWFEGAGLTVAAVELVDEMPWQAIDAEFARAQQAVAAAAADVGLPSVVRGGIVLGWDAYAERVQLARSRGADFARPRVGARFWRFYVTKGKTRRRFAMRVPPRWAWRAMVKALPGVTGLVRAIRR